MGQFIFVSLGLLAVVFSLTGTGAHCPCGWTSYEKYCYKAFNNSKNRDEAEAFCTEQGKGGHLASIECTEEADFVATLARRIKREPSNVRIGLKAVNGRQQCSPRWSDSSRIFYENLYRKVIKKCVTLSNLTGYKKWHNNNCDDKLPFICKILASEDPVPQ